MSAKIWYLYHSGFAVKTDKHFLIFDYWKDTGGGLKNGAINPDELVDEDVIVFASHVHGDHYNPEILNWRGKIPKLRIILSDDIPPADGAFMVGKRQILTQPDFYWKPSPQPMRAWPFFWILTDLEFTMRAT